jgi:ribosomal protein S18 acetylase RimI-like enzyme
MIHLEPMNKTQFQLYLSTAVQGYAETHIKAGDCRPEEALTLAQKDYEELLPDGLLSKDQFLFSVRDDALDKNDDIGMIWFAVKEKRAGRSAFIYDFNIREDLRGKGYGKKVMESIEELIQEMGINTVSLNVFGYNHAARNLYEKMGYQITGMGMTKTLGKR